MPRLEKSINDASRASLEPPELVAKKKDFLKSPHLRFKNGCPVLLLFLPYQKTERMFFKKVPQ
jgi:hypothetical protein